jgi:hypothetical protein
VAKPNIVHHQWELLWIKSSSIGEWCLNREESCIRKNDHLGVCRNAGDQVIDVDPRSNCSCTSATPDNIRSGFQLCQCFKLLDNGLDNVVAGKVESPSRRTVDGSRARV